MFIIICAMMDSLEELSLKDMPAEGIHPIMETKTNSRREDSVLEQESAATSTSSRLTLARMVLAEMTGTFILVVSTCGIVACLRMSREEGGLLEYALTGGLAICTIVFSIGRISGAHVNPSITIALATIGHFPWSKVPFYVSAQMSSSIFAAWVGKLVYNMPMNLATTRPFNGRGRAFFAEFIATMFILFTASSLSVCACAQVFSGLALGIIVALAVLITGPVSGGSMNPARSFGPAVVSWSFDDIWVYFLAPTSGAIVGALLFRLVHIPERQTPSVSSSDFSFSLTKDRIHSCNNNDNSDH